MAARRSARAPPACTCSSRPGTRRRRRSPRTSMRSTPTRRRLAGDGLPALTAIDEGSVEPSAGALAAFVKGLPSPLSYPVADDASGRVADGYEVQGEPWFVLTNRAGQIVWYQEMYTSGWPSLDGLVQQVKAALRPGPSGTESAAAAKLVLRGSPAPLAALHAQSSQLLAGGQSRWTRASRSCAATRSWSTSGAPGAPRARRSSGCSRRPRRSTASGSRSSAPTPTTRPGTRARSCARTRSATPATRPPTPASTSCCRAAWQGTPTTVFIGSSGKVLSVHIGQYDSQGTLDQDIEDAALGSH